MRLEGRLRLLLAASPLTTPSRTAGCSAYEYSNVVMTLQTAGWSDRSLRSCRRAPSAAPMASTSRRHAGRGIGAQASRSRSYRRSSRRRADPRRAAGRHLRQCVRSSAPASHTKESALASKGDHLRRGDRRYGGDPPRSRPHGIPYYCVDAVVHAPFGAWPGNCAGYYGIAPTRPASLRRSAPSPATPSRAYVAKYVRPSPTNARDVLREADRQRRLRSSAPTRRSATDIAHETGLHRRLLASGPPAGVEDALHIAGDFGYDSFSTARHTVRCADPARLVGARLHHASSWARRSRDLRTHPRRDRDKRDARLTISPTDASSWVPGASGRRWSKAGTGAVRPPPRAHVSTSRSSQDSGARRAR